MSKFRVGPLNYRYQFALITFSYEAVVHFYLDTYQNDSELLEAIEQVKHDEGGPTLTGKALRVAREQILSQTRPDGMLFSRYFKLVSHVPS